MARIRTIKPEFFTSEQVVECSPMARLLFVGMWCFCDDGGVHPASAVTLKMEVFPADPISVEDVRGLVSELESQGLVTTYSFGAKSFWRVLGWHHQKIDKPTYKHPRSKEFGDESTSVRRAFDEPSTPERNGTERSRDETSRSPDRSVGAEPDRIEKAAEKERNRADMISSIPSLTESALIAVDPLPAKSLAEGAFAKLQDEHLSNARSLTEWFKRQLSLPDPVCGHTRADLLLILAAGLHAAKMPSGKVKKTRCAVFVNVVTRGRWRQVTRHLREAEINLLEFEKTHDSTPSKAK